MKYKTKKNVTKRTKRWIFALIGISFAFVASVLIYFYFQKQETEVIKSDDSVTNTVEKEYDPSYITETCFDGSTEVAPVLYSIPFKKTDLYIQNKELVKYLNDDDISTMQDRMSTMIEDLLGTDGKEVGKNAEEFQKKFETYLVDDSIYVDENGTEDTVAALVAKYVKALSDSGYSADVTFETDKSLIFSDGSYYMRGLVTLTVYSYNGDADLSSFIPADLKQGETIQFVTDIAYIYSNETRGPDDIRICSIENIKTMEKEEQRNAQGDGGFDLTGRCNGKSGRL